ncbi:MAG: hypothetical protein OCC46_10760 [Pseudodesulfovibrio sp.]
MGNEVELARLDNWNELIRLGQIVIPATLTGVAGFLGGWWQHKRRMKTLEDSREFAARELLFNFRKEQYDAVGKSAEEFSTGLAQTFGELSGAIAAGNPPQGILDMADGLIDEAALSLSRCIKDAQENYSDSPHFPRYADRFEWYQKALDKILTTEIDFTIKALMADYKLINEMFVYLQSFTTDVFKDELTETVEKYVRTN